MTDVPEEPAGVEPERGPRRTQRVGDSGSPVGSTLSIVLAVVAVIAGFLILRAITDDDDGDGASDLVTSDTEAPGDDGTTPASATPGTAGGSTTAPVATVPPRTTAGATVVVANASGIGGSAGAMSTALEGSGYTMGTAGNSTAEQLATSVVYYIAGDAAAQAVATSVATDMGGLQIAEMPATPPIDTGLGTSTVLVWSARTPPTRRSPTSTPLPSLPPPSSAKRRRPQPAECDQRRSVSVAACSMHQRGSVKGAVLAEALDE